MRTALMAVAFFARESSVKTFPIVLLATFGAALTIPAGLGDNFLTTQRVSTLQFVPGLLPVVLWVFHVPRAVADTEALTHSRRLTLLRLTWYVAPSALIGVAAYAGWASRGLNGLALLNLRNAVLAIGLATVAGVLLSTPVAWLPGVSLIVACWLWGSSDLNGTPALWAVPNYPSYSAAAWIAAVVTWVGGGGLYVSAWSRGGHRSR